MAGVCKLSITETSEELKNLLTEQKTASGFQKIQALYLFKICHVKTVKELAMTIGVNRITVQRWLRKYRSYGLEGLLETKHSGWRKAGDSSSGPRLVWQCASATLRKALKAMEKFKSGCSRNTTLRLPIKPFMQQSDTT